MGWKQKTQHLLGFLKSSEGVVLGGPSAWLSEAMLSAIFIQESLEDLTGLRPQEGKDLFGYCDQSAGMQVGQSSLARDEARSGLRSGANAAGIGRQEEINLRTAVRTRKGVGPVVGLRTDWLAAVLSNICDENAIKF